MLQPPVSRARNLLRRAWRKLDGEDGSSRLAQGPQERSGVDHLAGGGFGLANADQPQLLVGDFHRLSGIADPHGHRSALLEVGVVVEDDSAVADMTRPRLHDAKSSSPRPPRPRQSRSSGRPNGRKSESPLREQRAFGRDGRDSNPRPPA